MALSAEEIADFRMVIGDHKTPYRIEDSEIQTLYTRADEVFSLAVLYALRRMLGMLSQEAISQSNQFGITERYDQRFTHLMKMYEFWKDIYLNASNNLLGEGSGDIEDPLGGLDFLDLNIDTETS